MRTASSETEYREYWERIIDDLALLALRANIPYDDYREARTILNHWLDKAIERSKQ